MSSSKELLKFMTCGSVDDGKSTLIGRLLWDSKAIPVDQAEAITAASLKQGNRGGAIDYALLLDGLQAEREQGITIDVAYRYFESGNRRFIVADTPGHEQYTRNMVTGASTVDAAVLLVDARKGLLQQTRRHAHLVALMGIDHVILAVNKMDLAAWSEQTFTAIADEFGELADKLGIKNVRAIPLSALGGDNVVQSAGQAPWYDGPPLLGILENLQVRPPAAGTGAILPVQWVNRPHQDFRGFAGTLASGTVRPGTRMRVFPSGQSATVERVISPNGDVAEALAGEAVTLTLTSEVGVARGDILSESALDCSDQFAVHLVWLGEQPMLPGRVYDVRIGTALVSGQITRLKYRIDVNTLDRHAATQLELNEIAFCNIGLDRSLPYLSFAENKPLGAFILIDRMTNATVGAGMIAFGLRRASNIRLQSTVVDKAARSALKGQKPFLLWLTGLSGAGKSTIANGLESRLWQMGRHTYMLDGDNMRHGLSRDLGFTDADRVENIRRAAEAAKLLLDAGLVVFASFISPFRTERRMVRDMFDADEFLEIFVDTSLEECERRDPKGLYRKARSGQILHFTGINSPYEPPEAPDLTLKAGEMNQDECIEAVLALLHTRGLLH